MTVAGGRGRVLAALPAELAARAEAGAHDWAHGNRRRATATRPGSGPAPEIGSAKPLAAATRRAYLADWEAFCAWCHARGVEMPPAAAGDVAVYLAAAACAAQAGGDARYRTATALRWASSISAVHERLGYSDPCARPPARDVIAVIRALPEDPVHRARPLLAGDVGELMAHLPAPGWPAEPARRRDRLIVALGFAAALSPSGLTALTLADVIVAEGEHALVLRTRNGPIRVGPAVTSSACAACGYASWRELIDLAEARGTSRAREFIEGHHGPQASQVHVKRLPGDPGDARRDMPLLRRIRRGGTITAEPITAQVITQVLRRLAAGAGFDPAAVTGLSLRAASRLEHMLRDASAVRP
jgi:hypothetical protein